MARSESFRNSVSVGVQINKSRWFVEETMPTQANVPCYYKIKEGDDGYWQRRLRKDFKDVIAHYN